MASLLYQWVGGPHCAQGDRSYGRDSTNAYYADQSSTNKSATCLKSEVLRVKRVAWSEIAIAAIFRSAAGYLIGGLAPVLPKGDRGIKGRIVFKAA